MAAERTSSFGQGHQLSVVDRVGRWLSTRRMRRLMGHVEGRRVADVGCGYDAALATALFGKARHVTLVDIAVDPALTGVLPELSVIEGYLPQVLAAIPDATVDVVICNNVLEHLWKPTETVAQIRRLLAPGGIAVVNVPSWRGKTFLELAAFRLHLAPKCEMDDHKAYYDPRELWRLLVESGFLPSEITCRRHKLGLNTIAAARKAS